MKGSEQKLEVNTQAHTILKIDGMAETAVCVVAEVCLLFLPANSKPDFCFPCSPLGDVVEFWGMASGRSDVCHFQA